MCCLVSNVCVLFCGWRRRALEVTNLTPPPVFIGLSPLLCCGAALASQAGPGREQEPERRRKRRGAFHWDQPQGKLLLRCRTGTLIVGVTCNVLEAFLWRRRRVDAV